MKIAIISSSIREGRETHKVALALDRALADVADVEPVLIDLKEYDLPGLVHVRGKFDEVPEDVARLGDHLDAADGIIFVSPEYNGGYSSALKNAIDFFPKSTYHRKPVGVATASSGRLGGMRAAQQLLHLALALWAIPSPTLLLTAQVQDTLDEDGNILNEGYKKGFDSFVEDYLWLAKRLRTTS